MILKQRAGNAWRFIDHITIIDVEDGEAGDGLMVHYERKGERQNWYVDNDTYLLNDEGKTIECIFRRPRD